MTQPSSTPTSTAAQLTPLRPGGFSRETKERIFVFDRIISGAEDDRILYRHEKSFAGPQPPIQPSSIVCEVNPLVVLEPTEGVLVRRGKPLEISFIPGPNKRGIRIISVTSFSRPQKRNPDQNLPESETLCI